MQIILKKKILIKNMKHYSVLLNETINKLNIKDNGIYVDATLGMGGHSEAILKTNKRIKLIAFDQDKEAIEYSKERLKEFKNIKFINKNFSEIKSVLKELKIKKVDGILFDLGTSYHQLKSKNRGFTYNDESEIKLDMRMNLNQKKTAIDVLNKYDLEKLIEIFYQYGDEKRSKELAKKIVEERQKEKIETNYQLNKIIKSVKGWDKKKHSSKNIYQAVRIEVNDEIGNLKKGLKDSLEALKKDGIITIITFHSLEDRIVKEIFWEHKNQIEENEFEIRKKFRTFKVIYPSTKEIKENNPSRSAKLRIIKKNYE